MGKVRSAWVWGVAASAIMVGASSASAVTMKAVYKGTVTAHAYYNYDGTNLFGAGTGYNTLDGMAYTMTIVFDSSKSGATVLSAPNYNEILGGTTYGMGVPSPIESAALTINGHTEQLFGAYSGYVYSVQGNVTQHFAQDMSGNRDYQISGYMFGTMYSAAIPVSLDAAYAISEPSCFYCGYYNFSAYDYRRGLAIKSANGYLTPESLTVTQVSAVPLPAALPLFAAGLGAIGLGARRRAQKA